jgi:hypothetical protein
MSTGTKRLKGGILKFTVVSTSTTDGKAFTSPDSMRLSILFACKPPKKSKCKYQNPLTTMKLINNKLLIPAKIHQEQPTHHQSSVNCQWIHILYYKTPDVVP